MIGYSGASLNRTTVEKETNVAKFIELLDACSERTAGKIRTFVRTSFFLLCIVSDIMWFNIGLKASQENLFCYFHFHFSPPVPIPPNLFSFSLHCSSFAIVSLLN